MATSSRVSMNCSPVLKKLLLPSMHLKLGSQRLFATCKLERQFPNRKLKEPTVCSWVNKYKLQLRLNHQKGDIDRPVKQLDSKKRGQPLLLGFELDNLVQSYILQLRENGGVVNTAIVMNAAIEMEEIPPELVINLDHTGKNYIPVSSWTMAKEGAKHVEIFGVQDKRQMTVVFAGWSFSTSSTHLRGKVFTNCIFPKNMACNLYTQPLSK